MRRVDKLDQRCGIYQIEPDDAAKFLENPGAKNRPIKASLIDRYAGRMKAGIWTLSGEPILLDGQGALLDGEHRLRACIQSEKPLTAVVLYGDFKFGSMGQGSARIGADAIAISLPSSSGVRIALSAIAGHCIRHERAMRKEQSIYSHGGGPGVRPMMDIDNSERVAWAKKNLRVVELYSAAYRGSGKGRSLINLSSVTAAWYLAELATGTEEAKAFFEGLVSGAGLNRDDIRLCMRQAASNRIQAGLPKIGGLEMFHWCAKAWAQRGERGRRIFGVKKTEAFPFIR